MVGLAYEMKRAGYLNAIVEMMFALSIHLRCGMNTGNVLVGCIGRPYIDRKERSIYNNRY
jgi:hypothetical protein